MIKITEYEIIPNDQYEGSNEVYFKSKPTQEVIQALKNLRMRWNPRKGCWYGFRDVGAIEAAINGESEATAEEKPARQPRQPREKTTELGVKVGDIFSMTWGYDQTQTDYFQVVSIVGPQSVRVREVNLPLISDTATGFAQATRVYKLDRSKLHAPSHHSVFIKDQERGDIKRLQKGWRDQGVVIKIGHHYADLCTGETDTAYDSWDR